MSHDKLTFDLIQYDPVKQDTLVIHGGWSAHKMFHQIKRISKKTNFGGQARATGGVGGSVYREIHRSGFSTVNHKGNIHMYM